MAQGGLGGTNPLADRKRRVPSVIPTTDTTDDSAPAAAGDDIATSAGSEQADQTTATPAAKRATKRATTTTKRVPATKRAVSVYVDAEVDNQARNAILGAMAAPGAHRNLSAFVEEAMRREIRRLQNEFNHGKPFPQRQVELQLGRPLSD